MTEGQSPSQTIAHLLLSFFSVLLVFQFFSIHRLGSAEAWQDQIPGLYSYKRPLCYLAWCTAATTSTFTHGGLHQYVTLATTRW